MSSKADRRDWKTIRTRVLKSEDPCLWFEEGGAETELCEVMESIYQYIQHVLYMDDNPLRHLRKHLPDFKWEFHKISAIEKLVPVIGTADYIWTSDSSFFMSEGIVTATEIGRTIPRVMLYCPETTWPSVEREYAKLRSLLSTVQFVFGEDGVGTVVRSYYPRRKK